MGFADLLNHLPFLEQGKQSFLGSGFHNLLRAKFTLTAGEAQSDVPGGHLFHGVCFIEDNKIILEEHPALPGLIHRVEQGKEKRMVENQHIGRENPLTGLLRKNTADASAKSDLGPHDLGEHKPRSEQTCDQTLGLGA